MASPLPGFMQQWFDFTDTKSKNMIKISINYIIIASISKIIYNTIDKKQKVCYNRRS